jgi:hypothetical protein
MKAKLVWLAVGSMLLGGCEAVSDMRTAVQERAVPRAEARTKTFPGSPRLVYEAVRAAAGQMGYRFVRGGPAQGEFDAVSNVDVGETRSSARQLALKVRLNPTLDGTSTEVIVTLTEIIESDSANRAGLATETPLRDTPQYEVFFRRVGQALGAAERK